MSVAKPSASVIIPAYESQATIAGCLRALRSQTFPEFEVIIVDSSPSDGVEKMALTHFPEVRYEHSPRRLLPHAARNLGVQRARSDLLVFTDPDVYPEPKWIEQLVAVYQDTRHVIVGAIACFGRKWIDAGVHFCKFDKWLPGGQPRLVDISPTVNMLCPRNIYEEMGGFVENLMLGDTEFSWRLTQHGHRMWFVPTAVVRHHHLTTWSDSLRERYQRGKEFAFLRMESGKWGRSKILLYAIFSALPLRLVKIMGRGLVNTWRAKLLPEYLWTSPIALTGHGAWLMGETTAYIEQLLSSWERG